MFTKAAPPLKGSKLSLSPVCLSIVLSSSPASAPIKRKVKSASEQTLGKPFIFSVLSVKSVPVNEVEEAKAHPSSLAFFLIVDIGVTK